MKSAVHYRVAQGANAPVAIVALGATLGSIFGLNRNVGAIFWLVLLAPIRLILRLSWAASFRGSRNALATMRTALPPLLLAPLVFYAMVFGP